MKPALPPYSPWEWRVLAFAAWMMALAGLFTYFTNSFPSGIILGAVILTVVAWRANRKVNK